MSVPFSNTHLRVPRGFSALLMGLTREVMRDQPEDISKYAAQYFDTLLKEREASGTDPAEWAARLEDRFYNNHAFKATEVTPEEESSTEMTDSKEKSYKSQSEGESSHSADTSDLSTTQPYVTEEADLTGSTEEYEERHDTTEKHVISVERRLLEEELVNMLQAADVQPDDLSGAAEEEDPTINTFDQVDRAANGKDSCSTPNRDIPQSELEPASSFREISNVDVCAQKLGTAEDEGGDEHETAAVDEEVVDSGGEENTDIEQPVEAFTYTGRVNVDVCAAELGGTEETRERAAAEDDEDSSKPQPEEVVLPSLSQPEAPEHEADQVEETKKDEGAEIEASSEGIHESVAHIETGLDSDALPKEDSLVEISFEDVPKAQQVKEVEEKQPDEEGSGEEETIREMQQEGKLEEVTVVATHQNISSTQDHDDPEMMVVKQEINAEVVEMESQLEASDIMKEKVDTNDPDLNDTDDDEKCEGVESITSSHQPTTGADKESPQDETYHKDGESEKINEGESHQSEDSEKEANKPEFKEDETTDTGGGDKEDIHLEGYNEVTDQEIDDGDGENHSSQVTQSNVSATEAESENLEAQYLPEESQRTPVESQPEGTEVKEEVTSKERSSEAEEGNSKIKEKSDATCEEGSVSPTQSAHRPAANHQGEDRRLGSVKDSTDPGGKRRDQEECSRPQEEEDIMDIPLDDPEANRAAAKIQAGFRGHMTRKKMKPEDKAEGEEVSSTGDVLNGSQGDTETGGSGAVERDDTSVPEQ